MTPLEEGVVVWLTGLPASGKTTIARAAQRELERQQVACCVLDSDEVRARLHPSPGYDDGGREAFYATLAELAALLASQGLVVLVAATAHLRAYREHARRAAERFVEVHVRCDPDTCAERDPKGLYKRARAGEIAALPGATAGYEAPDCPDLAVDTTQTPPDEAARAIASLVLR